jgi:hypothetical protein
MDAPSRVPADRPIRRRSKPRNLPRRARRAFLLADLLGYPRLPLTGRA